MTKSAKLSFNGKLNYWIQAEECRQYQTFPLTVEADLKLLSKDALNLIMADGYPLVTAYKLVGNHWRLYTQAETGFLCVFLSNMEPTEVCSQKDICDGVHHRIALTLTWDKVCLFVDGENVIEQAISPINRTYDLGIYTGEGPMFFGGYPPLALTCQGALGQVRISAVERRVIAAEGALGVDHATVGLWDFSSDRERFQDLSLTKNPAQKIMYLPSLDANDRRDFGVSTSPFDRPLEPVVFGSDPKPSGGATAAAGVEELSLDGNWSLVMGPNHGLSEGPMLNNSDQWDDAISAIVPGTVQRAMLEAGLIEDPLINRNNLNMDWLVNREWWYRKTFKLSDAWSVGETQLVFEGVDYEADFWLNGVHLGQHEGMFGGPEYDVTRWLKTDGTKNELVVRIYPAPVHIEQNFKNNVAYGWHYVRLVTLGIWRSVRLIRRRHVHLSAPFLKTTAIADGDADVVLSLDIFAEKSGSVDLEVTLTPKNFSGKTYSAGVNVGLGQGWNQLGFSGKLTDVHLWWPNGLGDPDFYSFSVRVLNQDGLLDSYEGNWGARTIDMVPLPKGPKPYLYDSQMTVNGQNIWQKGANWCYVDPLLRLDERRMARFVRMAKDAHIQILRVWGGGPIENDVFYDLCDQHGILVQQEFSILGFHQLQDIPGALATDITEHMVKRLRNRPSLAIWNCANEIRGQGRIVEILGRRCLELDGSRPFRRSCPYGGDVHWYGVFWEGRPILDYRQAADGRLETWSPDAAPRLLGAPSAFTEFGLSSPPNLETWERIIPEDELNDWPPKEDAVFLHHTPTYTDIHVDLMSKYASKFLKLENLPALIQGMQLSQGMGLKFLIESMRARKPDTIGTMIYKWTDNYPACAWSVIDYYGVPKRAYYDVKSAYAPLHVLALFDTWDAEEDGGLEVSFHAVNDTAEPVSGYCEAVWLDGSLQQIRKDQYDLKIGTECAAKFADIDIRLDEFKSPVILVLSLFDSDGTLLDRNMYPFAFPEKPGCLFACPMTRLAIEVKDDMITIENRGSHLALSVNVDPEKASNTVYFSYNHFCLFPGETAQVRMIETQAVDGQNRRVDHLWVQGWNVDPVQI